MNDEEKERPLLDLLEPNGPKEHLERMRNELIRSEGRFKVPLADGELLAGLYWAYAHFPAAAEDENHQRLHRIALARVLAWKLKGTGMGAGTIAPSSQPESPVRKGAPAS